MRHFVVMGELFTTRSRLLTSLEKKALENNVGIKENVVTSTFFFSRSVFYSEIVILEIFHLSSANAFNSLPYDTFMD